MFKIIEGDIPKSAKISIIFDKVNIVWGFGKDKTVELVGNIQNLDIVTEENKKKLLGTVGWGAVGGVLLGPLGILGGAILGGNKKEIAFVAELKDGRKFFAIADPSTYQKLVAASMK